MLVNYDEYEPSVQQRGQRLKEVKTIHTRPSFLYIVTCFNTKETLSYDRSYMEGQQAHDILMNGNPWKTRVPK